MAEHRTSDESTTDQQGRGGRPRDNRTTCLGILVVFIVSGALMVAGGLHYLKKFGTANGVVLDAATGAPIEGATVEMYASFPSQSGRGGDMPLTLHTETGKDGAWVLRLTVGGSYRLTIRHPDYATNKREDVQLAPEGDTDLGTAKLTRRPKEALPVASPNSGD